MDVNRGLCMGGKLGNRKVNEWTGRFVIRQLQNGFMDVERRLPCSLPVPGINQESVKEQVWDP